MKLLPQSIAKTIPERQESPTGKLADLVAYAKFFTPWTNWTWFVTEYNPETRICFGWVIGFEQEAGYFSVEELEGIRGPAGLTIERDLYFDATRLGDIEEVNL